MTTTEADRPTKNGRGNGVAEGLAEGIVGSVEGLTTIARDQAEVSFKQGEKVGLVLRDQSILSIKAAEDFGLSVLSTYAEITAPFTPKLPTIVPVGNLDTLVKAGFDITQQLLTTERKLAETAVALVIRRID
ncbi:MAG: hypothetical protein ACLPVF_00970 [Acidimicrobiales bacterium]